MAKPTFRLRLAHGINRLLLGANRKDFIPPLPFESEAFDGGRLNNYGSKAEQVAANIGWCFAANTAIADPCAAVTLKLYRKKKDGDREEIKEHEILDLLDEPNLIHTGEQLRQLHFTYMNFVGESYIHMIAGGTDFVPGKGKLPSALEIFPAHKVTFRAGETYTKSVVKYSQNDYPLASIIRDINPNPDNPLNGRSIIAASAATIDTENQMKEWNRGVFANGARPSMVFSSEEPLDDKSYERWKAQFADEHTGTANAHKPLLIEGGKVTTVMLDAHDLDFLNSRKFSRDEILAMWRTNPGILGLLENVNRASLDAAFYVHALVNVVPRVRQFVRQLNAAFIKTYDPAFELDFENPVPEDVEAKLKAATAGVDKWWTKDEVRDMYGEKRLPDGLGEQIIIVGKGAQTLEAVIAGVDAPVGDNPAPGEQPAPGDNEADTSKDKALPGVKKKP